MIRPSITSHSTATELPSANGRSCRQKIGAAIVRSHRALLAVTILAVALVLPFPAPRTVRFISQPALASPTPPPPTMASPSGVVVAGGDRFESVSRLTRWPDGSVLVSGVGKGSASFGDHQVEL